MYKILVFDRGFPQISIIPSDARRALGDFKNPLRAPGIWAKIPSQKIEFSI